MDPSGLDPPQQTAPLSAIPGNTTLPNRQPSPKLITKTTPRDAHHRPNLFSVEPPVPSTQKRLEVAFYTAGRHYGPAPVEEFFQEFMPFHDGTNRSRKPPPRRLGLLKSMASKTSEPEMYPVFVQALQGWPFPGGGREVKLEFRDNHTRGDPNCAGLAVDVAVGAASTKGFWRDGDHIAFAEHETHVEFKIHANADPYNDCHKARKDRGRSENEAQGAKETLKVEERVEQDEETQEDTIQEDESEVIDIPQSLPDGDLSLAEESDSERAGTRDHKKWDWGDYKFENSTDIGTSCRGQLAYYAAAAMTVQYRTHFFQLLIFGRFARFIRWDRSCAIVTQRFDYIEEPELIFEFYQRFAQLDRAGRGYDEQVTRATKKEAAEAREAFASFLPDGWHGRSDLPRRLHRTIESQAFLKLMTDDGQQFIIAAPTFYPDCYSPFGRSTRRSLAYRLKKTETDSEEVAICYMKDYLAQNYPTTLKEAEVYRRIQEKRDAGVNVPPGLCTMIAGGDVPGTETKSYIYSEATPWNIGNTRKPIQLVGHRIFLKEVGASIRTFPNFKTVLNCAADAMEAHSWLFHELKILHRDVSPGNILMKRDPIPETNVRHGYLIDFDHALDLGWKDDSLPPGRSGTRQFFSIRLLEDLQAEQTLMDDRESCFYSIVWLGMLHLKHSGSDSPEKLHSNLHALFVLGDGWGKRGFFSGRKYSGYGWKTEGLNEALDELEDVFQWRYQFIEADDAELAKLQLENQERAMALLKDRQWMHDVLRKHVALMPEPLRQEFITNRHRPPTAPPSLKRSSTTLDTQMRAALDGHLPVPNAKRRRVDSDGGDTED
ncbi:hypothetical protein V5O48_002854 [Marasmius crinis-equi]|uniref:Fungal-type protein kinase domain-containing protein n=1 Tax=Marasmius crinis-equi TaxID=585013 RepID=A0ABR3FUL1_9AGAR